MYVVPIAIQFLFLGGKQFLFFLNQTLNVRINEKCCLLAYRLDYIPVVGCDNMLGEMQLVLPGALYINIFAWYFSDFGQTTRGCPWIAALLSASFLISFAGIPSLLSLFFMNNCQSKFGLCIFFLLQLKCLQLSMKWPKISKNESKIIQNNKYFQTNSLLSKHCPGIHQLNTVMTRWQILSKFQRFGYREK